MSERIEAPQYEKDAAAGQVAHDEEEEFWSRGEELDFCELSSRISARNPYAARDTLMFYMELLQESPYHAREFMESVRTQQKMEAEAAASMMTEDEARELREQAELMEGGAGLTFKEVEETVTRGFPAYKKPQVE
jgi:hypothetical protein